MQGFGPCLKISNLIDKHFPLGLKSHSDCNPSLFAAANKAIVPSPLSNLKAPPSSPPFPQCLDVFYLPAIFPDCNQQAPRFRSLSVLVLSKDCTHSRQLWPPTVMALRARSQRPRRATTRLWLGEVARDRTEDIRTAQATMLHSRPAHRRPPNNPRKRDAHLLSRRLASHLLPVLPLLCLFALPLLLLPTRQVSRDLTNLHLSLIHI